MNVIYSISNCVDGQTYIGQSCIGYKERWKRHRLLLNANAHFNTHLQRAWNKYGADNFEFKVLSQNIPESWLDLSERGWILFHRHTSGCYNLTSGGNTRKHFAEETKYKISVATQGRIPWNQGKHTCTEAQRQMLREQMLGNTHACGTIHSAEFCRQVSLRSLGNKFWAERIGYMHSPATKQKMQLAHIGCCHSEETKQKLRDAAKRRWAKE